MVRAKARFVLPTRRGVRGPSDPPVFDKCITWLCGSVVNTPSYYKGWDESVQGAFVERWFAFVDAFWKAWGPWLALALWVAWLWLGLGAVDQVREAYDIACGGNPCRSIGTQTELFAMSVLANAVAVPGFIYFLRKSVRKP